MLQIQYIITEDVDEKTNLNELYEQIKVNPKAKLLRVVEVAETTDEVVEKI